RRITASCTLIDDRVAAGGIRRGRLERVKVGGVNNRRDAAKARIEIISERRIDPVGGDRVEVLRALEQSQDLTGACITIDEVAEHAATHGTKLHDLRRGL